MAYTIARMKVRDYDTFKTMFDGTLPKMGARNGSLYRSASNPNEVVVVLEWEDLGKARKWQQSSEVQEALQRGGLEGTRQLTYLESWDTDPGLSTMR